MSPERIAELKAVISNTPELAALAETGQDAALAVALSEILPPIPKPNTLIGERGIYDLLKTEDGEAFLQTVESLAATESPMKSTFMRVDRWLKDPIGLDVGSSETQEQLQALVPPFKQESVDKVIAFGSRPQVITADEVSEILLPFRPDGKVGA